MPKDDQKKNHLGAVLVQIFLLLPIFASATSHLIKGVRAEIKSIGGNVYTMLVFGIIFLVLLISTWVCILLLAYLYLQSFLISQIDSLCIILIANFLLLAMVSIFILNLKNKLFFPGLRKFLFMMKNKST